MIEEASELNIREILRNNDLEVAFHELKRMVPAETIMNPSDLKIIFTLKEDALDKQLGYFTSQDNKPIAFFSRKLSNPHSDWSTKNKEILSIVECLKQLRGIIFG